MTERYITNHFFLTASFFLESMSFTIYRTSIRGHEVFFGQKYLPWKKGMHVKEKCPQMFLAVTKWHYNGQFAVMIHKIFTLEEMNACEREMSANVPRGHEMAL